VFQSRHQQLRLQASTLTLYRSGACLFRDITFTLAAGEVLWVLGPNGSGKTSLLRVLCGLTQPDTGRTEWDGGALAYAGHLPGLKNELSVSENLGFFALQQGASGDRCAGAMRRAGVQGQADAEVRTLSAGQKRRAALARVLMSPARLWILDEPAANLDAAGRELVGEVLHEHLRGGGLAVVATHDDPPDGEFGRRRLVLGEVPDA
jgi:heme exporter protein A